MGTVHSSHGADRGTAVFFLSGNVARGQQLSLPADLNVEYSRSRSFGSSIAIIYACIKDSSVFQNRDCPLMIKIRMLGGAN